MTTASHAVGPEFDSRSSYTHIYIYICVVSSGVRIRRCQRCGPGSIPGRRINMIFIFLCVSLYITSRNYFCVCVIILTSKKIIRNSQQRDSNSRPPVYETGAITTMLCRHSHTMYEKKSHSALTVPEWSPTSVLGKPNDA